MLKIKKPIVFSLIAVFTMMVGLPANAGYYKTIYVNEPQPATTVIVNQPVQERVIVQEHYVQPMSDSSNAAITALGIGALVGGIILGVASHNHHKKIQTKHYHKHSKPHQKQKGHRGHR